MAEADGLFIYRSTYRGRGGLLGEFPPYKKTGLTGPLTIYKVLP